ncbi:MAG: hypothetical protein LBF86_00995 [Helicobacteraceae bacterium]|nr:hypothetical protein [Helicobacteraceae bacterium]
MWLRIALLALLLGAIYFFFFRSRLKPSKNDAIDMIKCAKCDAYIAADEAIIKNGKTFCSKKCAEAKR